MTLKVLFKLTVQGMMKRKTIYFPYFLAIIIIMALEFIMFSLMSNEFVQTRHASLSTIIFIGVFFTSILVTIFILYANNFIQKQRRLEFATFTVLGLEQRHLVGIIVIEQIITGLITSLLAVGIGHVFGSLLFIALNRLMRDMGATLMDYPFSGFAAILTCSLIAVIMLAIIVINMFRLLRAKPTELFSQSKSGEAEPKSHWFVLLIGLVTLAAGYYIALTTTGVLDSLLKVFIAIFLVIIATYALFISLSIIILKLFKSNKKLYYKAKNFLSISGLLYRMKSNAVSLASITILSTGIVLTLGTTLTLYLGMDQQVERSMIRDYELQIVNFNREYNVEEDFNTVIQEHFPDVEFSEAVLSQSLFLPSIFMDNQFLELPKIDDPITENLSVNEYSYIYAVTLEDFNNLHQQDYQLADDEVLYTSIELMIDGPTEVTFEDRTYQASPIDDTYMPPNYIGALSYVVFPDMSHLEFLQENFKNHGLNDPVESTMSSENILHFNAADEESKAILDARSEQGPELEFEEGYALFDSKEIAVKDLYSLNGGFLFLGMVVGVVLLVGTIMMLYYKQVSEGYEDQKKFHIMKQVGLPDNLIKSTIRQQIFWVFALPVIAAVIHSSVASKIFFELLGLFSIRGLSNFIGGYGTVLLIFVIVYYIIYLLTARVYYSIINQRQH